MKATSEDYDNFLEGLTPEERELLAEQGIEGPPGEVVLFAGAIPVREEDGLPKFRLNGGARVGDPLAEQHKADEEDDAPDELRADLAAGLRKVFLWILAGLSPRAILQRPQVVANRLAIVGRVLGLNGLGECTLADLGREGHLTRAAFSKIAINFRDAMGNKFLTAKGDRDHHRGAAQKITKQAWGRRKAHPNGG